MGTRRRRQASAPPRTGWHILFARLVSLLLRPTSVQLRHDLALSLEPLRLDNALLLPRPDLPPPTLLRSIFAGWAPHTLIHLKGATDELERDDALQLAVYLNLYRIQQRLASPDELALRVLAPALTPRFAWALAEMGVSLSSRRAGESEGELLGVPLRVIETSVVRHREGERLLGLFEPRAVQGEFDVSELSDEELALFERLAQDVVPWTPTPGHRRPGEESVMAEVHQVVANILKAMPAERPPPASRPSRSPRRQGHGGSPSPYPRPGLALACPRDRA